MFSSFIALAPAWASCRPLALPTVGGQSFDEIAESLLPELKPLEGFVLLGESFSGPIAARLSAAFSATEESLASHLSPPLLSILGTNDHLVSLSRSRAFFSRVPQSTVAEIEGPHLIVQTKPTEVWAAISEEFETAA